MTVTRQEGHLFSLGRCTYCVLTLGSYKKPLIPFYRVSLYQAEFAHAPARTPSLCRERILETILLNPHGTVILPHLHPLAKAGG